jgi:hypothetical protein
VQQHFEVFQQSHMFHADMMLQVALRYPDSLAIRSARGCNAAPARTLCGLRDKLPEDAPGFRQIIYGYDTTLIGDESFQIIDDIALSLIAKLRSIGGTSIAAKPLIFFAHSLGGIVLKRALVTLAGGCGGEELDPRKDKRFLFLRSAPPRYGDVSPSDNSQRPTK